MVKQELEILEQALKILKRAMQELDDSLVFTARSDLMSVQILLEKAIVLKKGSTEKQQTLF